MADCGQRSAFGRGPTAGGSQIVPRKARLVSSGKGSADHGRPVVPGRVYATVQGSVRNDPGVAEDVSGSALGSGRGRGALLATGLPYAVLLLSVLERIASGVRSTLDGAWAGAGSGQAGGFHLVP